MAEDILERKKRLFELEPEKTIETIYEHLANGGDIPTLAEMWEMKYSEVFTWVSGNGKREARYMAGIKARNEFFEQAITREVKRLALTDIRQLYKDDGELKPISEWPADIAASVTSLETDDLFEGSGKEREKVGVTRKVKLADKLKALELLGRGQGMFAQQVKVSGKLTYEDFMASTYKKADDEKK